MITVNLGLSKKLKEAGYPQKGGYFTWSWYGNRNYPDWEIVKGWGNESECASPTADEILEVLPFGTTVHKCEDGTFTAHAVNQERLSKGDTASNALAKLWLYLKQNNLLEVKE